MSSFIMQESLPVIEILNPGLPSPERIATLRQFTQVDETDINTHHLALVAFLHVFTAIIDRHMELSGLRIQVSVIERRTCTRVLSNHIPITFGKKIVIL